MTLSSTEIGEAIKAGKILVSFETGRHPLYVYARVDSGASMSSIDYELALMLGETWSPMVIYTDRTATIKSSFGKEERSIVGVTFSWDDSEFVMDMNTADRKKLKYPVLLGRDWLGTN